MNTRRLRSKRRAGRLIGLAVLLVGSVTAFFVVLTHPEASRELPAWLHVGAEPTVAAHVDREAVTQPAGAADTTPVYRHSVVPGGVRSAMEVERAIRLDPVVRGHYKGLDVSSVHVVTVAEPRTAYVSYRVGDQIHWTNRQVRLEPGEQLLTDGTIEIRARCGNLVSDSAVETTLADSTPVETLDEIEPEAAPLLARVNERIGTPAFLDPPASPALAQAGPSIAAGALGVVVPPVLMAGSIAHGSSNGPGHDLEIPSGSCRAVGF